jgi:hypothetical protein
LQGDLSEYFTATLPDSLEPGSRLELVAARSGKADNSQPVLAAVVSAVPLREYGRNELEVNLADPAWTATRAIRHEKVVQHFASVISVIPLRFGTLYLDRMRLGKMLRERTDDLLPVLERLRGREEWGVNVYFDASKLRAGILRSGHKTAGLENKAAAASPGQSYLERKRIDSFRAREARLEIGRVLDRIEDRLLGASDAAKRLRVLKMESGDQGRIVGRFAFLVRRRRFEHFQAAARNQLKSLQTAGFSLELTGPWPAYNFIQP